MSERTRPRSSKKADKPVQSVPGLRPEDQVEVWRDIPGYVGHYQVSNRGRVKTLKGCRGVLILKGYSKKTNPYVRVLLMLNGKGRDHGIHALMWTAFKGPIPEGKEINHKNGIKYDNRLDNFELMTHSQNVKHAYDMNLIPSRKGEGNVRAVLTDEDVIWMRKEYKRIKEEAIKRGRQKVPYGTILGFARQFGITTTSIKMAISGKSWGHLR